MKPLRIEATARTPEIDFQFAENRFLIKGESYPEDITAFYGPVINSLREHLASVSDEGVDFTIELIYFNSSSAKVLMELFETLDGVAVKGSTVQIRWVCEEDDENMQEMGEEFAEELTQAAFTLEKRVIE